MAVSEGGPVEIELIQVLEGDTPHSEHLRAHGEGVLGSQGKVSLLLIPFQNLERYNLIWRIARKRSVQVGKATDQDPFNGISCK